jgi:hypothetical protein
MMQLWLSDWVCDEMYMVFDSCFSGGFLPELDDSNRFIMSSCMMYESCLEWPSLGHGIFTYYFLDSIDQAIDSNQDNVISMEEQSSYAHSNTVDFSYSVGYCHHPLRCDEIPGQTVLYPSLGIDLITFSENQINCSFYVYGNGFINTLVLKINYGQKIIDLLTDSCSNTGFGYYSVAIQLEADYKINNYEIIANISGNNILILRYSNIQESRESNGSTNNGSDVEEKHQDSIILIIIVSVIAALIFSSIAIYLRKVSRRKENLIRSVEQKSITSRSAETISPMQLLINNKYCTVCGSIIKINQKFCTKCGTSLLEKES